MIFYFYFIKSTIENFTMVSHWDGMEQTIMLLDTMRPTPRNKARQRFDDADGKRLKIFILKYNIQALI